MGRQLIKEDKEKLEFNRAYIFYTDEKGKGIDKAKSFLEKYGYKWGSTSARTQEVGVQKGEYTLTQKTHNYKSEDWACIDGKIIYPFHETVQVILYR